MLTRAKDYLRRQLRAVQRGGQYPVLLPHHVLTERGVKSVDGTERALDAGLLKALPLCDGWATLAEVSRKSEVARAHLIAAQDEGLLLIWRWGVPVRAPAHDRSEHSIIVSPHPDDAALSCGGRMLGDELTLVLNIFTKTAWWRFKDQLQDVDRIQACRRMEEELVARLSGCATKSLELPEALLRGHAMEEVFTAAPDERDAGVPAKIREAIDSLVQQHPLAHWFLPLGVGDHIDHRIARDAAAETLAAKIQPTHLHFYEDLPYAAKMGRRADFSKKVAGFTLAQEVLEIEELIGWKLEMLRAYWSQFRWPEIAELKTYARAVGGEVVWNPH